MDDTEPKSKARVKTSRPCWSRLWWELRPSYGWFSIEEPAVASHQHQNGVNGTHPPDLAVSSAPQINGSVDATDDSNSSHGVRLIDVVAAFAPQRPCFMTIFIRAILLTWSVQVLYVDVRAYPPHNLWIYFGYLTHWGHFLSIIYLLFSFVCSLVPTKYLFQTPTTPSTLVRITWGFYSTVTPLEIAITLLYWSAIASSEPTYVSVMEHGGVAALVLLDGSVVGLVPVRVKHVFFLMTVCFLYLAWSLVNAVLHLGNGEWGPAYSDDALYPVLNWNDDWHGAAIVSAFSICILAPCLFLLCWLLSLRSGTKVDQNYDDENEGHPPNCCDGFDGSRRQLVINDNRFPKGDQAFAYGNIDDA